MTSPSGQISLADVNNETCYNDATQIQLNEERCRRLVNNGVSTSSSGTTITVDSLRGKNAFQMASVPPGVANFPMATFVAYQTSFYSQAGMALQFIMENSSNRIRCGHSVFNSGAPMYYNNYYADYCGDGFDDTRAIWQVKVTWALSASVNGFGTVSYPAGLTSGTWYQITNTQSRTYNWVANANNGSAQLSGTVTVCLRAYYTIDGATKYFPATSAGTCGPNSNTYIRASVGNTQGPLGPE
jgi:hypothetical protein